MKYKLKYVIIWCFKPRILSTIVFPLTASGEILIFKIGKYFQEKENVTLYERFKIFKNKIFVLSLF